MMCDHIRTRPQGDTPFFPNMLNNWKVEVCLKEDVDAAIAELKAENERQANELRATRRALWLARAERAKEVVASANGGITKYGENDNALRYFLAIEKAWKKIEQLCRAKAEEYK